MKIEKEILDTREAQITVEVDDERWQKALKDASRRISTKANIPGFRKGKAPYHIIKQYFGDGAIIEEALDPITQEIYREALEEAEVEPYAMGALTDVSFDPVVFTYVVPLAPEIKLGDYRDVRVEYEVEEVTDEDVQEALEEVQDGQATLEAVEEPVEMGMAATLDIYATMQGEDDEEPEEWLHQHDQRVLISERSTYPVHGFPQHIIGMVEGDEKSFEIVIEDDNEEVPEDFQGKTFYFDVTCKEVFKYDVPELDDEFAQSLGEFETLDDLRADIREQLEQMNEQNAREEYLDELFETLEDIVEVSYPPVIIDEEIDLMVERFEQQVKQQGLDLETYMSINDLDEDEIREDFRDTAERRVRRGLILGQIVEDEQLSVSEEEVDDDIQDMLLNFGGNAALAQTLFKGEQGRQPIRSRLLTEKAIDRLIAIGKGEAPEPDAEAEEEQEEVDDEAEEAEADADDDSADSDNE